jgi:hypothetical protein
MAWSSPLTATTNMKLTAAQWNQYYRDNMLETEAAKATAAPEVASDPDSATEVVPGTFFVATAANAIAERRVTEGSNSVGDEDTTSSTSYTDLDNYGPAISVVTGTAAIVMITCEVRNTSAASGAAYVDFDVSGATTRASSDTTALIADGYSTSSADVNRRSVFTRLTTLTAGTNVFTMKYRVASGTGAFRKRQILVWPV